MGKGETESAALAVVVRSRKPSSINALISNPHLRKGGGRKMSLTDDDEDEDGGGKSYLRGADVTLSFRRSTHLEKREGRGVKLIFCVLLLHRLFPQ